MESGVEVSITRGEEVKVPKAKVIHGDLEATPDDGSTCNREAKL